MHQFRFIVVVAALWCCASAAADAQHVAGEIIVAPTAAQRTAALKEHLADRNLAVLEEDAVSGVLLIRVPDGAEAQWVNELSAHGDVLYAERNGIGRGGGVIPDDTHFTAQWHHINNGQSGGTIDADLDTPGAWAVATGSPTIGVAVLDTGIDSDHPDFVGRIDPDGFDFVNEDSDPEADHPHGTWVSGMLGATGDNAFAVAGVDWNCRIVPIKVLNGSNLGTTFDLAQGLNYCAMQSDIQIISMSLIDYSGSTTLINALQTARSAGKILIACAGNGGVGDADVSWPGASPNTISIGATTNADARASFSGTGGSLDFVAPGASVVTVAHGTSNDTVASVSGCSFATPAAAGVASLMLDLAGQFNMPMNQNDIYDFFLLGAQDQVGPAGEDTPGRDDFFGHGRLNAAASLAELLKVAMAPPNDSCGHPTDAVIGDTPFDTASSLSNGPAEPSCGFAGSDQIFRDVWFRFIPPTSGDYTISTCDTTIDTRIAVYFISCPTGDDTAIACNDDACAIGGSEVTISANAFFTYWIRVGAATDETGAGVLHIAESAPPCPADLTGDGTVDVFDLFDLLNNWGTAGPGADLAAPSNTVDVFDLFVLLNAWGACP